MNCNYSNLQNLTNYIQISPEFPDVHFYLQKVNIPGIQLNHEELSARGEHKIFQGQDIMNFNTLSFEMLIDENLEIWLQFHEHVRKRIKSDNTFDVTPFQFVLQINNNKGNKLFTIFFKDCRISSIQDLQLDSTSDITQHNLQVDIVFDKYDIIPLEDYIGDSSDLTDPYQEFKRNKSLNCQC